MTSPGRVLVLVVEDKKPIADLLRLYLCREGLGVQVEADGRTELGADDHITKPFSPREVVTPGQDGARTSTRGAARRHRGRRSRPRGRCELRGPPPRLHMKGPVRR
jgi:DNA-binding response OmpR family regulator